MMKKKTMTKNKIAELEQTYQDAMRGCDEPKYIGINIPGIGFVEGHEGKALHVNEKKATHKQAQAVTDWFNARTPRA